MALQDSSNQKLFDAFTLAFEVHSPTQRKSGDPYISHPVSVLEILINEFHIKDPALLSAALLHDVVEDTHISIIDIQNRFGSDIAELVDGCTKLTHKKSNLPSEKDLTHTKILLSASRQLGVLLIKLADRLDNMRTLEHLAEHKRRRIARETIEIFAPIAAILNLFPVKRELYKLSIPHLFPKKSKLILSTIETYFNSTDVKEIIQILQQCLSTIGYPVEIRSRLKGLDNYYDSLRNSLSLNNAENHVDFTVIIQSPENLLCYKALGIINSVFNPVPKSIRDFIANSKTNGYQSLHVRIIYRSNYYLIKIRSAQMDTIANYGAILKRDTQISFDEPYWQEIRQLLRSIGEYGGPGSQRKELLRLYDSEETFIYTPKRDIHYVPKGSIVLDVAYKIHSDFGDKCEGANVNGEWRPIYHALSDGDTVEILTSNALLDVDIDIEKLCKTPRARDAVNRHIQNIRKRFALQIGKSIMMQEIKRHGYEENILFDSKMNDILCCLNVKDVEGLLVRIGQDMVAPHLVFYYFGQPKQQTQKSMVLSKFCFERNTISISEIERSVHKFSYCCHPFPGQLQVVAALSERGVAFHLENCSTIKMHHDYSPQNLLNVEWDLKGNWPYPIKFELRITVQSLTELFRLFSQIPPGIKIHYFENISPITPPATARLIVTMRNFRQAISLYKIFQSTSLVIEKYGRNRSDSTQILTS